MITTVTTTTVTTVTTVASVTMLAGLGLTAVLTLIVFLIARELLDAAAEQAATMDLEIAGEGGAVGVYPWVKPLSRALGVGIVPLLFVFGVIVLVRVMAVL